MGRFGQKCTWPDDVALIQLLEHYEANLWYWAGSSWMNESLQNELISRSLWVISNPSNGTQGFFMNDERREAVDTFKLSVHLRAAEYDIFDEIKGVPLSHTQL